MKWQEARDQTLDMWRDIRASIGTADPVDLLTEINVVCSLCEKAQEEAAGEIPKCRYCLASQQFGGCHGISSEMSLRVAERDWERLRELVDEFVVRLQNLDLDAQTALPTVS
jgi:hypothetical protein